MASSTHKHIQERERVREREGEGEGERERERVNTLHLPTSYVGVVRPLFKESQTDLCLNQFLIDQNCTKKKPGGKFMKYVPLVHVHVASPGQDGPAPCYTGTVAPPSCQSNHRGAGEGGNTLGGADFAL